MRTEHFDKFAKVADALDAVDREHPGSRAMKALRARIHDALDGNSHLFTDEQYVALGGGVPKTQDPET